MSLAVRPSAHVFRISAVLQPRLRWNGSGYDGQTEKQNAPLRTTPEQGAMAFAIVKPTVLAVEHSLHGLSGRDRRLDGRDP